MSAYSIMHISAILGHKNPSPSYESSFSDSELAQCLPDRDSDYFYVYIIL